VQTEFAGLDDESNIYKLVGPVLLKQDKTEATMAVNGRLEFIEKEMSVFTALITALITINKNMC
jgi:prefoldin beta subunit